ncbi:MAG: SLC13 family permease [Acidimicrobiales bacterium]
MSTDAWITLGVLISMVILLATDRLPPATAVVSATVALLITGVLEPAEAFAGFSSAAPITIAALYVVAGAVEKTAALQPVLSRVLKHDTSTRNSLARITLPGAAASSFLSNTPIVAMLVPAVSSWSDRHGLARSKFLIPISYATILGGVVTVLGTSTNLLVSSLLSESGQDELGIFEIAKIGLPVALVGLALIIVLAPRLMPDRRSPTQTSDEELRDFSLTMQIQSKGMLVGKTVEEAGLRHLTGVFLIQVSRQGEIIAPVGPSFVLHAEDALTFVGLAQEVLDLQRTPGLESAELNHVLAVDDGSHRFFEAVIGGDSPLAGRTLKQSGFRGKYQAAVLGIHRSGHRVVEKLGSVTIRPGDTLLILADAGFRARWRNRRDFLLVSRLGGSSPAATKKAPIVIASLVFLVVVPALQILSLLKVSLIAAAAMLLFGVLTRSEARDSVQADVVIMIGAAFGLGNAMLKTGLANDLVDTMLNIVGDTNRTAVLLALVLLTVLLTELITNSAAAVIAVPIALQIGARTELQLDPRILVIAVAVTASCSFLTPIGYQTNTMVYGPGGYRYSDYVRLGTPLSVATVAVVSTMALLLS